VGDVESGPFRLSFNPQLRIEFRGATVTSDAGLLLPRELDESLGLSALIERHLTDPAPDAIPISSPRSVAPVHLQPPGRVRGHQRRGATGRGPDIAHARPTGAAKEQRGAHLDAPLVRNGCPRRGVKLPRTHSA